MVQRSNGFSLVELLVVIAIVAIIAAIALPQLMGAQAKAKVATCEDLYHELSGEVGNELDGAINGGTGHCGVSTNSGVVGCVLGKHSWERNPWNRAQNAYIATSPQCCQVQLQPVSSNGIAFFQPANCTSATGPAPLRSTRIVTN